MQQWIKLPHATTIIAVAVILATSLLDGLRDATWCSPLPWWPRHILKWLAFYPAMVWILVTNIRQWIDRLAIALAAWATWTLGLVIAGCPWDSSLLKVIKWLVGLF